MTTRQIQRAPERAWPDEPDEPDEPEDSWCESDDSHDFDEIIAAEPSLMHDIAMAQLEGTLSWLGLPAHIADNLVRLVRSAVAHRPPDPSSTLPTLPAAAEVTDDELLDAAASAAALQGWSEAVCISSMRSLSTRAGSELLGKLGVADEDELTRTQRERWRARVKSVVANELSALTGWGIQDCHDRVGVALAPRVAAAGAEQALVEGRADWRAVRAWWRRCGRLPVADAGAVADVIFAAPVAGDGAPQVRHWSTFVRDLEREAVRVEGDDAAAARRRRLLAVRERDVRSSILDDGTGCLNVTGGAASVVAATDRIELLARRARAAGDPRALNQLRADAALALLVHGTVPLPRTRADKDQEEELDDRLLGSEADSIARILQGLPTASVEVIVPLDALVSPSSLGSDPVEGQRVADGTPRNSGTLPVAAGENGRVAELVGHGFISVEHARELALMPDTIFHRLVTDPLDGRLVERSTTAYRPDAAMSRLLAAFDRLCRGPGCTVPASRCERDHEQSHASGGPTTVANLNHKHGRHHWLKTIGAWKSAMDESRNVTWTTLFGRVYRTRPHDYREYTGDPRQDSPEGNLSAEDSTPFDRDYLVYLALASRNPADDTLVHESDTPDGELAVAVEDHHGPLLLPTLRLEHRRPDGLIVGGPPPRLRHLRDDAPVRRARSATSTRAAASTPGHGTATQATEDPCPF